MSYPPIPGQTDLFPSDIAPLGPDKIRIPAERKGEIGKKLDGVIRDLNQILQVKQKGAGTMETVHFSELVNDIKVSIHNLIEGQMIEINADFAEIDSLFYQKRIFVQHILQPHFQQYQIPPATGAWHHPDKKL